MSDQNQVRITVDVPEEDVARLEDLAESFNTNKTTALVKSIRTLSYLQQEVEAGTTIELVSRDGTTRQLTF